MSYNSNIHHRRSIRLKGYDYSQAGLYFVTICVQNRQCLFGEIVDGEMVLNEYGQIVYDEWIKSAAIRKEIEIHEFIVMPNHFHAIVEIVGAYGIRPEDIRPEDMRPDNIHHEDMHQNDICQNIENNTNTGVCHTPLRSPSKTVGALMRGFKSSVTKKIGFPVWQRNYYEHIIRDEKSYQHISEYIINNPSNWEKDIFITNKSCSTIRYPNKPINFFSIARTFVL